MNGGVVKDFLELYKLLCKIETHYYIPESARDTIRELRKFVLFWLKKYGYFREK